MIEYFFTLQVDKNKWNMRKKIVAGNWKMNLTLSEATALATALKSELQAATPEAVQLIVCPPFPYIHAINNALSDCEELALGAQNCAEEDAGAYTGEVSAKMIASVGANYVIIGHSERRALYNESDAVLVKKLNRALAANLTPLFCCGETLAQREAGEHFTVIANQLSNGLFQLSKEDFSKVVIAYEPVWAIGTGVTASADQAQEIHAFIRKTLEAKYGMEAAQNCTILYGGSCNAGNAAELFGKPDVDGGLIGGASLKAKDFISIANSF